MQTSSFVTRKKTIGFTLLEVIVASFLAAVLLTILVRVSSVTYRIGNEEIQRGALESRLLLTSKKLESDLLNTSPGGVSLTVDGSRMLCQPIAGVLPSGRVAFSESFIYWNRSQVVDNGQTVNRLSRSEVSSRPDAQPFDGNPYRWPLAKIAELPPGPAERVSVILDGVTKFSIYNPPGVAVPQVGSPLLFEIEVELPIATTRKTIRLVRSVQVRTSGA